MKTIQRTKILPLRWLANQLSYPATSGLLKAFRLQEQGNLGYRFKFYSNVWHYLNKPYERWGTVYSIELDELIAGLKDDPVLDKLGSDYDEDGIPYWENEGGPVNAPEERLKYMEENGI